MLISVVLPVPLGARIPRDDPTSTRNEARSRMTLRCVPVQKDLETLVNSSIGYMRQYCCHAGASSLREAIRVYLKNNLGAIMSFGIECSKEITKRHVRQCPTRRFAASYGPTFEGVGNIKALVFVARVSLQGMIGTTAAKKRNRTRRLRAGKCALQSSKHATCRPPNCRRHWVFLMEVLRQGFMAR